jgi:general secretion pathway protein L
LRKTLADSVAGANFLTDKKRNNPLTVALLDDLSRRLPEDTYLERLQIEGGKAQLQGQSKEAAKLIALIGASDCLANPSLQGQIQPDPRTGKERFQITADVKPCNAPASAAATAARETKAAAAHAVATAGTAEKKEPAKASAPKALPPKPAAAKPAPPKSDSSKPVSPKTDPLKPASQPKTPSSRPASPPRTALPAKPIVAPAPAKNGAQKPEAPVAKPRAPRTPPAGQEKEKTSTEGRESRHGDH